MADDSQTPPSRAVAIAQLTCMGATQQEIADRLGVHRHTVAKLQDTPEVQEEIERIQADARKAAKRAGAALVTKTTRVWGDALDATTGQTCANCGDALPDHAIRLRAADSVADRFGLPKTEVQELHGALTLGDKSEAELERVTLEEAVAILQEQGHHELAAGIKATLAP